MWEWKPHIFNIIGLPPPYHMIHNNAVTFLNLNGNYVPNFDGNIQIENN